ncbi:MAG TPA: hypothetical protein VKD69_25845, partial [Vicinamibacterales bacterium]|nr:hypothetical protein [Vicinamibacterales bacterium]
MSHCWYSRLLFERLLAAIYCVAFLVAANQFVPLLGERGLEPVSRFVRFELRGCFLVRSWTLRCANHQMSSSSRRIVSFAPLSAR